MIVNEYQRRGMQIDCPPHNLARIDRHAADRTRRYDLIPEQAVSSVEKQAPQLLRTQIRHGRDQIVDQSLVSPVDRATCYSLFQAMRNRTRRGLQDGDTIMRGTENAGERIAWLRQHGTQRAELIYQLSGAVRCCPVYGLEKLLQD